MKPMTDFLPEVLPHVLGCTQPLAITAIRNSVIEFLEKTRVGEQSVQVFLNEGVASYDLDPEETGTSLREILRASIAGIEVYPVTVASLDANNPAWRTSTGSPRWLLIDAGMIRVVPIPVADAVMDCVFSAVPNRSAAKVDDYVLDNYMEAIASGALRRLMAIPGFPWSNPALARYHKEQFDISVSETVIDRAHSNTSASIAISPRRFGG